MFNKDYLNLAENHEFNVIVYDESQTFAGNLTLSPQKCVLRVMGEREPSKDFFHSRTLQCRTHNFFFGLHELKSTLASSQVLKIKDGKTTIFFEHEFIIGFIVYSKSHSDFNIKVQNFMVDTAILKNWIGYTTTQIKILEGMKNNSKMIHSTEFKTIINNYGELSLSYNLTSSWDSFSSINKSQPNLKFHFNSPADICTVYNEIKKLYVILAFLIGYDFDINQIKLTPLNSYNSSHIFLFFSKNYNTKQLDYTLFPLGHNLRFEHEFPPLPLTLFDNYYNLTEEEFTIFLRYHGYNRLKSNEEKFLGFFRLLEKLTYEQKSYVSDESLDSIINKSKKYLLNRLDGKSKDINTLLKRITRLNKSKYNTQTCIEIFYNSLPTEFTKKLPSPKEHLAKICKLRNDMTHANHFFITEQELSEYTLSIQILLYLALLEKIGVNPQQFWKVPFGLKYLNFF